jgi:uncharacterized protein (TIGR03084 family)
VLEQNELIADLKAENDELDQLVAGLDDAGWSRATPAEGWTVAEQIAHVSFIFRLAGLAVLDAQKFQAITEQASGNFEAAVNAALTDYLPSPPAVLMDRWRTERGATVDGLAQLSADTIVPWLVRPIPARVLACAGLMELFGHGQDVRDALEVRRTWTDRVGPVAWFVTQTWDFGYQSRGETPPDTTFRFDLTAPSGATWHFGPEDAVQRITGPAEDLCLLATRRRHRDDLGLTAHGRDAEHWLDIAQCYRGPAGAGRRPGQFAALAHR